MKRTLPLVLLAVSLVFPGCQEPGSATEDAASQEARYSEPDPEEDEDLWPKDGDEALEWLLAGNERFVSGNPRHDHESIRRRMALVDHQHPFAVILGCADSRVSPELLFDHGLGDLFVIRVAGNVVAEDEAGSIEYAADHLDTPLVVVLGHQSCGAVTAALGSAKHEPFELMTLIERIQPALEGIDPALPEEERIQLGVEANVRQSVSQLREIANQYPRTDDKRMKIVGAVYELESGAIRILDE